MNTIKTLLLLCVILLLALLLSELILRLCGYTPWKPITSNNKIHFEPSSPFVPDTLLGYTLKPGTFRFILDDEHSFISIQNIKGHRVTSLAASVSQNNARKRINILGDSFTFGSFMDDSATYPWFLQKLIPNYQIENYAVPGYGVSNVFIQLKNRVQVESGDIVLYAYFAQHNNRYERRVLKMMYGREDLIGSIGYILLDHSLQPMNNKYDYELWALSPYSALINLLEDRFNAFADNRENQPSTAIALKAVSEMNDWCKKKRCIFVLIAVQDDSETKQMLHSFTQSGIHCLDISVDLNDPRYYSLPNDRHPNTTANRIFTERIYNYLIDQNFIDTAIHFLPLAQSK
jgi:hypothetical protein